MKKNYILILIVFGTIFLIFVYALLSGELMTGVRKRNENIRIYNEVIKAINLSEGDYVVLSGRKGGMFTFEIDFKNRDGLENVERHIQVMGFNKIDAKFLIYCNELKGIRFINRNKKVILEYQVKLSECNEVGAEKGVNVRPRNSELSISIDNVGGINEK